MVDRRVRTSEADGLTIARRLRLLKRRTARWFQPPVRTGPAEPEPADAEPNTAAQAEPSPSNAKPSLH